MNVFLKEKKDAVTASFFLFNENISIMLLINWAKDCIIIKSNLVLISIFCDFNFFCCSNNVKILYRFFEAG